MKKILSCFLCFTFILQILFAQVEAAGKNFAADNYENWLQTVYSKEAGLSVGKANAIATTKNGLIWVGTYAGLYRYNGSKFQLMKQYQTIKSVECLYVDDEDRLWVGTNDNGISIYKDEELVGVVNNLPSDSVRRIVKGADGLYYVGTSDSMAVVRLTDKPEIVKTIEQIQYADRITADSKGNVVAISSYGTMFLLRDGKILAQEVLNDDRYTSCVFDVSGKLRVGTAQGDIYVYDVSGGVFRENGKMHCNGLRKINSLIRLNEKTIFVCADNGIGYFYDEDDIFHILKTPAFNSNIYDVILDYQGNLWFASSRMGLLRLCKTSFSKLFTSYSINPTVVNTIERYNGLLYVGSDTGLIIIDEQNKRTVKNELTDKLADIRIRHVMKDSKGNLWLCTYGRGLLCYDGASIKEYNRSNSQIGNRARTILERRNGDIVVSSEKGLGLIVDGRVVKTLTEKDGLHNNINLCLLERKDGTLLAGSDGSGIAVIKDGKVDVINKKKDENLTSDVILRMVEDKDGDGTFVITSNSLSYMNPDGSIKALNNFPYSNNYNLIQQDDMIFVLSSSGIFAVLRSELMENRENMKVTSLDNRAGLDEALVVNSWILHEQDENQAYLATSTGVTVFDMKAFDERPSDFLVRVASIMADGDTIPAENGNSFTFSKKVNRVEIKPEVINYSTVDPIISCYLEGVDEKPVVMSQSEISSIVYTNLSPGKYTFHVQLVDPESGVAISKKAYYMEKEMDFTDTIWFSVLKVGGVVLVLTWVCMFIASRMFKRKMHEKEAELAHTWRLSITDDLTKLRNRVALRAEFKKYLGQKLTVIMMDIDYFKRYNDTYGHEVGDSVLQMVGEELLAEYSGDTGIAYRYGGDEFLIFDLSGSEEEARKRIERVATDIQKFKIKNCNEMVSISYGMVSGTPGDEESLRKLQSEADRNLYEVKGKRKHCGCKN